MLCNKLISVFAFILSTVVIISPAYAKKSKIQGDPELVWLSPLGSGDIENNAYNRCRLIRALKPGEDKAAETTKNTYDILSTYASNLYAQSIKVGGYIEAEKEKDSSEDPDVSDEKALLDEEVIKRLGDIARRMNIINSFEASTMLLKSLDTMVKLPPTAYSEFRVLKGGKLEYSSDCEDLKK